MTPQNLPEPDDQEQSNQGGKLIQQARSALETRVTNVSNQEPVLRQSRFWMKSVTWTLIGTTVFGIGWLAIARTEEVVIATGKLEPVGSVKDVIIPPGGIVEEILVKGGQRVTKGQALIRLDQESTAEQLKSLTKGVEEKASQIIQKEQQLQLKLLERERTLDLNREGLSTTRANLQLEKQILDRLEGLAKIGATPDIQYLQQRNRVEEIKGEVTKLELDGRRQINLIDQQIEQIESKTFQHGAKRGPGWPPNRKIT